LRNTFINKLLDQAEKDQSIFLVVGDLGYGVVETFENRFPERFLNAGIAEQNMIGLSAGLAKSGYKVFVYSIANFPTFRCLEQIRNDVCYEELDVTIVSVGAGFSYGVLGYSHFALEDIAIMRPLPGMQILSPSDPIEVELAVEYAVNNSGPKYLRLGKNGEDTIHKSKVHSLDFPTRIHDGSKHCVLVTGGIAVEALTAVQRFKEQFLIEVAVFSVPLITLSSLANINLREFSKIFTVEEHVGNGGFGSFVAEYVTDQKLSIELNRIFVSSDSIRTIGDQAFLRQVSKIDSNSIYEALINNIMN
jgi:transketolase